MQPRYIMRDQVHNRVDSIMTCDLRGPDDLSESRPGNLPLFLATAFLYVFALVITGG